MAGKCVHKGCGKVFTDTEEPCVYHPGPAVFHEGQKGIIPTRPSRYNARHETDYPAHRLPMLQTSRSHLRRIPLHPALHNGQAQHKRRDAIDIPETPRRHQRHTLKHHAQGDGDSPTCRSKTTTSSTQSAVITCPTSRVRRRRSRHRYT